MDADAARGPVRQSDVALLGHVQPGNNQVLRGGYPLRVERSNMAPAALHLPMTRGR